MTGGRFTRRTRRRAAKSGYDIATGLVIWLLCEVVGVVARGVAIALHLLK